jgi:hypothetical protein
MDIFLKWSMQEVKKFSWNTKRGLIAYSVLILFLSKGIIDWLKIPVFPVFPLFAILILVVPTAVHVFLWLIVRNIYYDFNILTVAFGISAGESSGDYYREIKKRFKRHICEYRIKSKVKVVELPDDVSFSDAASAEKYIIQKGMRLLIWGHTTEGTSNNVSQSQFNVRFSYQFNLRKNQKRTDFTEQVGLSLPGRAWGISAGNSLSELLVVSGNIIETSLYILGMCFATVPSKDYGMIAVEIFEDLRNILRKRRPDQDFPNLSAIEDKVKLNLEKLYNSLADYYSFINENPDEAIKYYEKLIAINQNNFSAHQGMALFKWLKGDREAAEYHTKRLLRIDPNASPGRLNKAFFLLYDRRYDEAWDQYKKIPALETLNVIEIICFIEREFEKMPDNLGLFFIAGWLNFNYGDHDRGKQQIQDFLNRAAGSENLTVFISEAIRIIGVR